jgi:hypothetical protein
MHFLHKVLPHGRVMGSWSGYEHCGHCANLTISRASLEASSNPSALQVSTLEDSVCFDMGVRTGRELLLRGDEDMNGTWSGEGYSSDLLRV